MQEVAYRKMQQGTGLFKRHCGIVASFLMKPRLMMMSSMLDKNLVYEWDNNGWGDESDEMLDDESFENAEIERQKTPQNDDL